MKNKSNRREFLKDSSKLCMAWGIFALCPQMSVFGKSLGGEDIPDPKKLEYCGYSCPPDCPLYVATIENDDEKKKAAYELWNIKERYGLEFDPEKVFCYRCKSPDKPEGVVAANCPVRACVQEKGFDCCIECTELQACEKDLWTRFPEFHKGVLQMQVKYNEAKAGA